MLEFSSTKHNCPCTCQRFQIIFAANCDVPQVKNHILLGDKVYFTPDDCSMCKLRNFLYPNLLIKNRWVFTLALISSMSLSRMLLEAYTAVSQLSLPMGNLSYFMTRVPPSQTLSWNTILKSIRSVLNATRTFNDPRWSSQGHRKSCFYLIFIHPVSILLPRSTFFHRNSLIEPTSHLCPRIGDSISTRVNHDFWSIIAKNNHTSLLFQFRKGHTQHIRHQKLTFFKHQKHIIFSSGYE